MILLYIYHITKYKSHKILRCTSPWRYQQLKSKPSITVTPNSGHKFKSKSLFFKNGTTQISQIWDETRKIWKDYFLHPTGMKPKDFLRITMMVVSKWRIRMFGNKTENFKILSSLKYKCKWKTCSYRMNNPNVGNKTYILKSSTDEIIVVFTLHHQHWRKWKNLPRCLEIKLYILQSSADELTVVFQLHPQQKCKTLSRC